MVIDPTIQSVGKVSLIKAAKPTSYPHSTLNQIWRDPRTVTKPGQSCSLGHRLQGAITGVSAIEMRADVITCSIHTAFSAEAVSTSPVAPSDSSGGRASATTGVSRVSHQSAVSSRREIRVIELKLEAKSVRCPRPLESVARS